MSVNVDMSSPDLDRQLYLLKYYPEVMKKHFRPRLYRATHRLKTRIAPTIPILTGRALAAFRSSVSGTGINMTGKVGWANAKDAPWYINVVEAGALPHEINRFAPGAGVYIGKHPGFAGRGFMAAGYAAEEDHIVADMDEASRDVLNEMAVK